MSEEQPNAIRMEKSEVHLDALHEQGEEQAYEEGDADPEHAAQQAHHHRLDQKLLQYVRLAGTDRDADADLAGSLHHRHQHDVHHPDAADDEGDHRDGGDQQRHGGGGFLHRLDDAVAAEGEEVLHPVALGQQLDGGLFGQRRLHPSLTRMVSWLKWFWEMRRLITAL